MTSLPKVVEDRAQRDHLSAFHPRPPPQEQASRALCASAPVKIWQNSSSGAIQAHPGLLPAFRPLPPKGTFKVAASKRQTSERIRRCLLDQKKIMEKSCSTLQPQSQGQVRARIGKGRGGAVNSANSSTYPHARTHTYMQHPQGKLSPLLPSAKTFSLSRRLFPLHLNSETAAGRRASEANFKASVWSGAHSRVQEQQLGFAKDARMKHQGPPGASGWAQGPSRSEQG